MSDWERENQLQAERVAQMKAERARAYAKNRKREIIPRKIKLKALELIAQGYPQSEVASLLSVSKRTVEIWSRAANKKFLAASEKAIQQGLEAVRTKTHENVVYAANILNAHLKAVENEITKDPAKALEIGSSSAKDYSAIAAKEYDKLKSIDSGHTDQSKRHSTQVNILQIQKEIEESDIVNSKMVFDVTPEQMGDDEKVLKQEEQVDGTANE